MTDIDYIIYFEHVSRELNGVTRLHQCLGELGLKGVVAPKHYDRYLNLTRYRPKVIILPYLYGEKNSQHLMFEKVYGNIPVLNLHSEQLFDETTKAYQLPNGQYAKDAYHISWGERFASAMTETGVDKKLIFKTGSIRNDDNFLKKDDENSSSETDILVLTSFSKTFVSADYLDRLTANPTVDETKYRRKVEFSRLVRDQYFSEIYKVAKNNPALKIKFRPHPYVDIQQYVDCFLSINGIDTLPENVSVERVGSVQDAIKNSKKVIGWYTSTLLDAYLLGKECVIFEPEVDFSFDTSEFKGEFLDCFNSIVSYTELEEFATSTNPGTQSLELENYINNVYGPNDGRTAERVAACIDFILKKHDHDSKFHFWHWAIYFVKSIGIDLPKKLLLKLNLLHRILPRFKGITEDYQYLKISISKAKKQLLTFKLDSNGYRVEE